MFFRTRSLLVFSKKREGQEFLYKKYGLQPRAGTSGGNGRACGTPFRYGWCRGSRQFPSDRHRRPFRSGCSVNRTAVQSRTGPEARPSPPEYSDRGIPILFRPFHEAEGTWFWWGSQGGPTAGKLYRLMFERYTSVHKLKPHRAGSSPVTS